MKIGELLEARAHPTVVRLDALDQDGAEWISESYYLTEEAARHLDHFTRALQKPAGCGIFLIGQYGSGKSHFLAFVAQQLRSGKSLSVGAGVDGRLPRVETISLVHYSSDARLEDVIGGVLGVPVGTQDRRLSWGALAERHPDGLVLIIDELSEFLRSKPAPASFNEDVRFLQYLGEWAAHHRLWIVAAMQEQIEHTGEIEHGLYRKIKDRYPLRFILSPAHVKKLIAESILVKKSGYNENVAALAKELKPAVQDPALLIDLTSIYPVHPATLAMLEEVRAQFSQSRGAIDFIVTQLRGDPARGVAPFLEEPFGSLITPDAIVDHFRDLLEVQPEFTPISQKLFPYYRQHLSAIFSTPAQAAVADRILKILALAYLSPSRQGVTAKEVADWLLLKPSRVDPSRNLDLIDRLLTQLTTQGSYVKKKGAHYLLELGDESGRELEQLVEREIAALHGEGDAVFEACVEALEGESFNPFSLPRDEWQPGTLRWHLHERAYAAYLGNRAPPERAGQALVLRLPWGASEGGGGLSTIVPAKIERSPELLELAALVRLRPRPLPKDLAARVERRISERRSLFAARVRSAYAESTLYNKTGAREPGARAETSGTFTAWLERHIESILRATYPRFESFAPTHPALPIEAHRKLIRQARDRELTEAGLDQWVEIIREGYLVPMKLMERQGREYSFTARLDRHELVTLVTGLVASQPAPSVVYEHLSGPIYGLVPDQIQLLLAVLLIKGEIDIVKGNDSYRDAFETLPNPLQYDRVVPGRALALDQVQALGVLADGLGIRVPKQWTVLAQRRAIVELKERLRSRASKLHSSVLWIDRREEEIAPVLDRIDRVLRSVSTLDKGDGELSGFERFLIEIESPKAFLAEVAALEKLPERLGRLAEQLSRLRHVLATLSGTAAGDREISEEIQRLGPEPSIADFDGAEAWIARAQAVYARHKKDYGERHRRYWESRSADPRLEWRAPKVAESRQVGTAAAAAELEEARAKAKAKVCRGLVDLDFQAKCGCGFDGQQSPIEEDLERLNGIRARIESALRGFFGDSAVRARVAEWHAEGIERSPGTLDYLEGKEDWPAIENVRLFDEHFAGVELVKEVDAGSLLEELGGRIWERGSFVQAIDRQLAKLGQVRFRLSNRAPAETAGGSDAALVAWCVEQALRFGVPLPGALGPALEHRIAQTVRPEWVGDEALARLGELGLGEAAVARVVELIVQGSVRAASAGIESPIVRAARDLVKPRAPKDALQLAELAEELYRVHAPLERGARGPWLERLDALAGCELAEEPPALLEALRRREGSDWLVIDCFGVALLGAIVRHQSELLPYWKLDQTSFAIVRAPSTTDSYHRQILEGGIRRPIEKVDVIDQLIHERTVPFDDLARLAVAELRISLRPILPRLDPRRPLAVFGDHGFRLSRDGRSYGHGGSSTLERVVPVLDLLPR